MWCSVEWCSGERLQVVIAIKIVNHKIIVLCA